MGTPSATGLSLPVAGTVAQVQSAFSTPISQYRLPSGKTGYDNTTAPEVDTTVAPQIQGILGLDTLSPPQPSTSVPAGEPGGAAPHRRSRCPHVVPGAAPAGHGNLQHRHHGRGGAAPGRSTPPTSRRRIRSTRCTRRTTTGRAAPSPSWRCQERATPRATSTLRRLLRDHVGQRPDQAGDGRRGWRHRRRYGRSRARHRDRAVHGAEGEHRSLRRRAFRRPLHRLQQDRQRRHGEDRQRQLDERLRGLRGSVDAELGEHAVPGGGRGRAVDLRGLGGPGRAGVQHQRRDRRATDGLESRGAGGRPFHRDPLHRQQVQQHVSVDSEGSTGNPPNFVTAGSVSTGSGSGPDAVALDAAAGKVFVADDSNSRLTVVSTSTCNQTTTAGCSSPTQIASGGHLNSPTALAVSGIHPLRGERQRYRGRLQMRHDQYVGDHGDPGVVVGADGARRRQHQRFVYVADGSNSRIEYFNASTCNATTTTGCSATPTTVTSATTPSP